MPSHTSTVPPTIRAASEWAWRLLAIAAALVATAYLLGFVSEAVIPVVVATLLAALLDPVKRALGRRLKPAAAAGVTVLGTMAAIGLLLLSLIHI